MAVKINYVDDSAMVEFKELKVGDMFVHCSKLYMKTENVIGAINNLPYNSILMINGKSVLMDDYSAVRAVDVEMRVTL